MLSVFSFKKGNTMYSQNPGAWIILALLISLGGALLGLAVGAIISESTKSGGPRLMKVWLSIATASWSVIALLIAASAYSHDMAFFVPGCLLSAAVILGFFFLAVPWHSRTVALKLGTAQKLLASEGSLLTVLDQDRDNVLSYEDIEQAKERVLGSPLTQQEYAMLLGSMTEFGHPINRHNPVYIITPSDLSNLRARMKEIYKNWREVWPDDWRT